jgi:hypothetical protein
VLSTDELTGLQALERKEPNLPLAPGKVELFLSILVRKLLRRGSFTSVEDLAATVSDFIAYYNGTMAKPFKWIYQGKALVA